MDNDLGDEYNSTVVYHLLKFYGDLLKVSRARFCMQSLPILRKYIAANPDIIRDYSEQLDAEIEGQGLKDNAVLRSLVTAQRERLEAADSKDSTAYASEIEKMIKDGKTDRIAGSTIEADTDEHSATDELIQQILTDPLNVDPTVVPKKVADEVRKILTSSFEKFGKWSFHIQMGFPFQSQDFHDVIFDVGQQIVDGKIDRVIITIPPRHSKTQLLSIALPLYSFCHNVTSHNIITSYAEDVVLESSGYIRTVMLDPLFQRIFPNVRIDPNKRSLERWGTTKQGVMHAVPTGGKMTGKGAGLLAENYAGCFVVDDVIKPKDAYSDTVRMEINDRYDNTFMSRLANDGVITKPDGTLQKCARTPMVIIMQRVHDSDLVGYLLRGGSADKYHYLNIPAIVEKETGSAAYYDKIIKKQAYTHAIPILYDLKRTEEKSALWPSRKSLESLEAMQKANPYTYNSQYAGDPTANGTGLVKEEWWKEYNPETFDRSRIVRSFITADTASTAKEYSDYSVLKHWGVTKERDVYCLDIMLGKYEVPELKLAINEFWKKCNIFDSRWPCCIPRALYMEDKSSGQFLNQQFVRDGQIRLMPVPRDKSGGDKVARFLNTIPYFSTGKIYYPAGHEHLEHVKREILGMTSLGSGTGHDDCCDNVSDMVAIEFSGNNANYSAWV
ncbi:putative terminase large subunit [Erwinia phage Fifi44]|uniref:Terminase large subunit n=1 Tax=Erwinia phage Fifi44 TaxID=2876597 RepID=A0AAE8Y1M4_9CAUD|nr:putative terminase large subunit [Erwinia phage Fifi44]UCR74921.1 putative terminase large subunit [Erwinia phage Fifi44]UCR80846.1 putative terminase large subunit [Erwinia phage Fifi451]